MGTCVSETRPKVEFSASFSVNLRQLYDYYHKLLMFLKPSQLFKQPSQELTSLVETYLANPKIIDKENLGICSIDMVHKLHPLDFGSEKVTKQWLTQACLRQNKFIQEFPYQILKFEESYKHYVQFLYMCFKSPTQIIVPNKLADFMWHSHMQDNVKYKEDSIKMLGKVLDHIDDYSEEQMKLYAVETENARKRFLRVPERNGMVSTSNNVSYHNFAFIDYGHSACGGRSDDFPIPDPHPHPDHHHHQHHHNDHHHPHHEDKSHHPHDSASSHHYKEHNNHNDHNNNHHNKPSSSHHDNHHNEPASYHHNEYSNNLNTHNDYGGHVDTHNTHSNCGGGASNCGGAASNCGGGASNCGGGGSSCGGGGGD